MKIAEIDYPAELLAAIRSQRLVVFAGAGISMGEPAGLPSFDRLAQQIAEGTAQGPSEGETTDRFLGRLKAAGVKVHEIAAKRLSQGEPQPNPLHHNLIRCFTRDDRVRVVTTNFDQLFERAAEVQEILELPIYSAPALPLGRAFRGHVHVHGSLLQPETMTLTDEDFGRGYLTEGWARRFLVDLFRSYSVLFVGYSHNDAVMSYLGRALPVPDSDRADAPRRFALTDDAEDGRWALLGITPIPYPMANANDHSSLTQGISKLATYLQRDLLSWQQTIADIAQAPPPLDPEQQDAIDDALAEPSRTRFFTDEATDPAWLDWLDRRGHLDDLFDPHAIGPAPESHRLLAGWLCRRFARDHAAELIRLFERRGMRVGGELWAALASQVGSQTESGTDDEHWSPSVVDRWISVLLTTLPRDLPHLEYLLHSLADAASAAGLHDTLVSVFDTMAQPSIREQKPFFVGPWALGSVWRGHLIARLDKIAERLLMVVNRRLLERYEMRRVWHDATRESDVDTWLRATIDSDSEDARYDDPIDVLVDAARDCLARLGANDPLAAGSHIDRMVRTDAPLLRRLAVHGTLNRCEWSADQKIDWLLANVWLYDRACRTEVAQFLERTYASASADRRRQVLAVVDAHPDANTESSEHDD